MSDKITKTTEPALPQACSVCSVAAKGYNAFYDFGVSIDYYGAILVCEDCAQNLSDLVNSSSVARLETRVGELEEFISTLVEQKKALENVVSAYLISDSSDSSTSVTSVDDSEAADDDDDDAPLTFGGKSA